MDDMERTAKISECGKYRYVLTRTWGEDQWKVCVIMLNPSTADALMDDATIRALIRLLKPLQCSGFEVVNLFALRATDPKILKTADDPVGPMNDMYIQSSLSRCDIVICAWGANPFVLQSKRGGAVLQLLSRFGPEPRCFGTTKAGAPKHPLYLKTGTMLEIYHG